MAARFAPVAVALMLAGCAHTPDQARREPPPVNLSGYSQTFRDGFNDGCETARGSNKRDDKRYAAEGQYAQGWQDGRAICAKR